MQKKSTAAQVAPARLAPIQGRAPAATSPSPALSPTSKPPPPQSPSSTTSQQQQRQEKLDVNEWVLPEPTGGPYKSITMALRANIRRKMEVARSDREQFYKLREYTDEIKAERNQSRKENQYFLEQAIEDVKKRSLAHRTAVIQQLAEQDEGRGQEARRRREEMEIEHFRRMQQTFEAEAAERKQHEKLLGARGKQWLVLVALAAMAGPLCGAVSDLREARELARLKQQQQKKKKRLGSFLPVVSGSEPKASVGGALVAVRTAATFIVSAHVNKKRRAAELIATFLKDGAKVTVARRALRLFYSRLRKAQRLSKEFLVVSQHRRALLRRQWAAAEAALAREWGVAKKGQQQQQHLAFGASPRSLSLSVDNNSMRLQGSVNVAPRHGGRSPRPGGGRGSGELLSPLMSSHWVDPSVVEAKIALFLRALRRENRKSMMAYDRDRAWYYQRMEHLAEKDPMMKLPRPKRPPLGFSRCLCPRPQLRAFVHTAFLEASSNWEKKPPPVTRKELDAIREMLDAEEEERDRVEQHKRHLYEKIEAGKVEPVEFFSW